MANILHPKLISWASDIDPQTILQAERTARLPIIAGHVALMPDAHIGIGATVGSVIPTKHAVIPAAVGVDLGCGMIAAELDISADDLPGSLDALLPKIERAVPAGVGRGHENPSSRARTWLNNNVPATDLGQKFAIKSLQQFGTLGAGNHFVEICLDERDRVWIVLHSGSRGVGNQLATKHIDLARKRAKEAFEHLEDPDLASFIQGTAEFDSYIADMHWAQDYALANREQMMDRTIRELSDYVRAQTKRKLREVSRINCHHNFCAQETHGGQNLWVTRKGAIRAGVGELGVIPGSMGTRSYIVRGLGNPQSFNSCSHGAGRRFSRSEAKRRFTQKDLREQMGDRVWMKDRASSLIDEIPSAYKDIDQVMADQTDLVEVVHTLHQILNYKGV
jgi:RNA-splicing ligase RtcB